MDDEPGTARICERMVIDVTHTFVRAGRENVPAHWFGPVAVMALGCALAWVIADFGHGTPLAVAAACVAVIVALWNSPLRASGHESLDSVRRAHGSDAAVVVLWRPGCPYSSALRRRASREGLRIHWVNIWRDEDAYELCRGLNLGAEETPTAVLLGSATARPVVIPASVPGIKEAIDGERGARAERSPRLLRVEPVRSHRPA